MNEGTFVKQGKTSIIDFNFFINQLQNAYLSLRMCWLPIKKERMYVCIYMCVYVCVFMHVFVCVYIYE